MHSCECVLSIRLQRRFSGQEYWLLFQRTIPNAYRQLTTFQFQFQRDSDALFWPQQVPSIHMVHKQAGKTPTHINYNSYLTHRCTHTHTPMVCKPSTWDLGSRDRRIWTLRSSFTKYQIQGPSGEGEGVKPCRVPSIWSVCDHLRSPLQPSKQHPLERRRLFYLQ